MPYKCEILVSESRDFSPRAVERLASFGVVRLRDCSYPELLAGVANADVLWVRLRHFIGKEVFDAAPRLRALVTATTGLNHIDTEEAARRGVEVLSLRGETELLRDVRATAEHTIALILALLRNIPAACRQSLDGSADRDDLRGGELFGKTVGLVGYGRLGQIVARYVTAFGARALATDRRPVAEPDPARPSWFRWAACWRSRTLSACMLRVSRTTRAFSIAVASKR